jgi:hypothetical protein
MDDKMFIKFDMEDMPLQASPNLYFVTSIENTNMMVNQSHKGWG